MNIFERLKGMLIPVLDIRNPDRAADIARLLVDCGAPALEVTLRSPRAWEGVEKVRGAVPELPVGVGSVLDDVDVERSRALGLPFAVSPGLSQSMVRATPPELLLIPGVATPSEVLAARASGLQLVKLFPAEVLGGTALLKALAGPFPDMHFFPTGGITSYNYSEYLELPNVHCVGATWLASANDIDKCNWAVIREKCAKVYKK